MLLILCALFFNSTRAQVLYSFDDFENVKDSSWALERSFKTESESYKGKKSLAIQGVGKTIKVIQIPETSRELLLSGWLKFQMAAKAKQVVVSDDSIDAEIDTTIKLDVVVIETPDIRVGAFLKVFFLNELQQLISEQELQFQNKNTGWISFSEEVKVPTGTKEIQIFVKNTYEGSTVFIDEIFVEERQVGFVKSETAWAKSLRILQERAKRLVYNGDFEDGGQVWNPYWGFGLSKVAHSGDYACLIQNSDSGAWKGSGNDVLFKIPKGTEYLKVSTWIKAENIVPGPNAWETGAMLLTLTDDYGNELPGGDAVARTVGTHDWRLFEATFPVSSRATGFNLALQLAASTGKIYFDDIMAVPMTAEEYKISTSKLKNPSFEEFLNGWPAFAGIVTNEQAHTGEYALKVSGENAAWEMRQQTVSLILGKKSFEFGVWIKAVNVTETPNSW